MNQFQSVDEVLSALRRRAPIMLFVFLIGCVGAVYAAINQTRLFQATAVIQIERSVVPDQLVGAGAQSSDSGLRLRLIEQRLMARDNVASIIDRYGLYANSPDVPRDQQIFQTRQAVRLDQIINESQAWQPGAAPSGLYISVTLPDAEKAAAIANDMMDTVIAQTRERSLSAARDTAALFEAEEAKVRDEIAGLEARIAAFKEANGDSLPSSVSSAREQIATLRETELALDREIVGLQAGTSRLRENEQTRQLALQREQKALVAARIAALETALANAPAVEKELNTLDRELEQLQERFAVIARRKAEAELGQVLQDRQQAERYEVLERALVPENPVNRSRKQVALLGALASALVALGVGFLLELMNPALRTAAQMEKELGLHPVVSIPHIRTRRESNRRRFKWLAILLAVLAAGLTLARNLGERLWGLFWFGFTGMRAGQR